MSTFANAPASRCPNGVANHFNGCTCVKRGGAADGAGSREAALGDGGVDLVGSAATTDTAPYNLDDRETRLAIAEAMGLDTDDLADDADPLGTLTDAERRALHALLDPEVNDVLCEPANDIEEVLERWDHHADWDRDDIGDVARYVETAEEKRTDLRFDFVVNGEGDGDASLYVDHNVGSLSTFVDGKHFDAGRGLSPDATGLAKAVYQAETIQYYFDTLRRRAQRAALIDVDMNGTPGMGSDARRISDTEARYRVKTDGRYHLSHLDADGEPIDHLHRMVTVTDITSAGIGYAEPLGDEGSVPTDYRAGGFATDRSGALYVLGTDGRPTVCFTSVN